VRKVIVSLLLFIASLITVSVSPICVLGQESSPEKKAVGDMPRPKGDYKVEFTLTELQDGQRSNLRSYTMTLHSFFVSQVRSGSRVPISYGGTKGFEYLDVGHNIDCRVVSERDDGYIVLANTVEVSSILPGRSSDSSNPVLRQLRAQTQSEVQLGKRTLISSLDDPLSTRRFQIEVTATKLR
jgi:hypothetical protein